MNRHKGEIIRSDLNFEPMRRREFHWEAWAALRSRSRLRRHQHDPSHLRQETAATTSQIGESRTQPGTVNALVVAYYQTAEWTALDPETQKSRKRIIKKFRVAHGDKRVALRVPRGHWEANGRNPEHLRQAPQDDAGSVEGGGPEHTQG
jgi:hypothetical protein